MFKRRYLLATCGGIENQPAKLELFKCEEDAAKTKLLELSFSKVKQVDHQLTEDVKQSIVLTLDDGRQISFYPEFDTEFKKWSEYCITLQRIPNHSIPVLPEAKSVKLDKCSDTDTTKLHASMYINSI